MLNIDIWESQLQHGNPVVYYPQGETAEPIRLTVKEAAIPSGQIRFFAHRSDGGEVYRDVPASDVNRSPSVGYQTVTIRPTDAVTCTPGNVTCQLEMPGASDTDSKLTFPFTIAVTVSPIAAGDMYKSSDYQVLKDALANLEDIAGSAASEIPNIKDVTSKAETATTKANAAADSANTAASRANTAANSANTARQELQEYGDKLKRDVESGAFDGATFTPSVDADGNISWTNDKSLPNPETQNIKGPKGDRGDGFTMKGVCKTASELSKYSATANPGDAYIVSDTDDCYIWSGTEWENIGKIKGPQGDAGPQGPQGVKGDKGDRGPYFTPSISDEGVISWSNNGDLPNPTAKSVRGPQGIKGEDGKDGVSVTHEWVDGGTVLRVTSASGTSDSEDLTGHGLTMLGTYDSYEALQAAHPSGNTAGDAYGVQGDYYVWNGEEWRDAGPLQGAPGPAGKDGLPGPTGPEGPAGKDARIAAAAGVVVPGHSEAPTVSVELGGEPGEQTFDFTFNGIQGADGEPGEPGKDAPLYHFEVRDGGNLYVVYDDGAEPPQFRIDAETGNIYRIISGDNEVLVGTFPTYKAATTGSLGLVKPDGSTITVTSDGTISSKGGGGELPDMSDYAKKTDLPKIGAVGSPGILAPDGSTITVDVNGNITAVGGGSGGGDSRALRRGVIGINRGNTGDDKWLEMVSIHALNADQNRNIVLLVYKINAPGDAMGILSVNARANASAQYGSGYATWLVIGSGLDFNDFMYTHVDGDGSAGSVHLWASCPGSWICYAYVVLAESVGAALQDDAWDLHNGRSATGTVAPGGVVVPMTVASLQGVPALPDDPYEE